MFEAADERFVKAVGNGSLLTVPNLEQANNVKLLNVVVKKNRFFSLFQKPKYEVTEFNIGDLTIDTLNAPASETSEMLEYNRTNKFKITGKIGANLKDMFSADLSGHDEISVDAKFGKIERVEIKQPQLMEALKDSKLRFAHQFVEQVRENKRKVLCVITDVVQTVDPCEIHTSLDYDLNEDIKTGKSVPNVTVEEEAEISDQSDKKFALPAKTALGYSCCELRVSSSGNLELIVEKGVEGSFDSVDASIKLDVDPVVKEMVSAILVNKNREDIVRFWSSLLKTPNDIKPVQKMIKAASMKTTLPPWAETSKTLSNPDSVKQFLEHIGFKFVDKTSAPSGSEDLLRSCLYVLSSFKELDDDEALALGQCSANLLGPVIYLLNNAINGKPTSFTDEPVSAVYKERNPVQTYITELGFQISGTNLEPPPNSQQKMRAASIAVYALWAN